MIVSCGGGGGGGCILQLSAQQGIGGGGQGVGIHAQWLKYDISEDKFVASSSFFIPGNKAKHSEVLKAQFTWDIISGLYATYLLIRDTRKKSYEYRIIRVSPSFDDDGDSDDDEYEELYKFGKPINDDTQEFWIFGGPIIVIATHTSSQKHDKILLSLSVVSMRGNAWSIVEAVDVPDLRRFPTCVGCAAVHGEIVAIINARPSKKGIRGATKREFCVLSLQEAPKSGSDTIKMGLSGNNSGKQLVQDLLQDLKVSRISTVELWDYTKIDAEEQPYNCLLGISTKAGGKLVECTNGKDIIWFEGVELSPKRVYVLQEPNGCYYLVHDVANTVCVYDAKRALIAEHTNVEAVLIEDFMSAGFDQVAFVFQDNKNQINISLVEIGYLSETKKKQSESEKDNIQAVCQSLRVRAIHAMDHLQNMSKTIEEKNLLLEQAVNMLKVTTSSRTSSPVHPTSASRKLAPFILPGDLVPLFDDQPDIESTSTGELREHVGPQLRVVGVQHSFGPTGDWDITVCICNTGSAPITCTAIFLVTPNFPLASCIPMTNFENSRIRPGQRSSFSLHSILPPITEVTVVDMALEWTIDDSLHNIEYLTRFALTPNLKSLEVASSVVRPYEISYAVSTELTLYSATKIIKMHLLEEIFTEVLQLIRTSSTDDSIREYMSPVANTEQVFVSTEHSGGGGAMVIHLVINTHHLSAVLKVLKVLAVHLPDYIVILPTYTTPYTFGVLADFASEMQAEITFILNQLSSQISKGNKTSPSVVEYYQKQQRVDNSFYNVLEHFNYFCDIK